MITLPNRNSMAKSTSLLYTQDVPKIAREKKKMTRNDIRERTHITHGPPSISKSTTRTMTTTPSSVSSTLSSSSSSLSFSSFSFGGRDDGSSCGSSHSSQFDTVWITPLSFLCHGGKDSRVGFRTTSPR
jgi:hypothetical protein